MILPGATLGVLGGGQLGRMFTQAARTMGYEVIVLDPDPASPAAQFATAHIQAEYTDAQALSRMAGECAAITTEFENVSAAALAYLAQFRPVRPAAEALAISQDRIREKRFLTEHGVETARFAVIESSEHVAHGLALTGTPAVLKISRSGYDGKGQRKIHSVAEAQTAYAEFGRRACVIEQWISVQSEISVVLARGADARTAVYTPSENWHRDGILEISLVPARISAQLAQQATNTALRIAEWLNYCGVLAVEFFVLHDGRLLVNEIAPRPHNTGHYTLDASFTSQFEQQVRALCGLSLGDTTLKSAAAMVNILGDVWRADASPAWDCILSQSTVKLHLYGKREARAGRKMGHYTCLAADADSALQQALSIQTRLRAPDSGTPNQRSASSLT